MLKNEGLLQEWFGCSDGLQIKYNSKFHRLSEAVLNHIEKTNFTDVGTPNVKKYWNNRLKASGLTDERMRRIMWRSVVYGLTQRGKSPLARFVERVMLK